MPHQDNNWELYPIGGETGDAFMGVRKQEKIFFKRNVSPFVTTLSALGITPKLKWTQRTYAGDILTAQEWQDGHTLSREEMRSDRVIQFIHQIHHSRYLLATLKLIDRKVKGPVEFIDTFFDDLPDTLCDHYLFNQVIQVLEDQVDDHFYSATYCVCHGDLNHHNFLMSPEGELYLVDWEDVCIADPLSDITYLLIQYVPPSEWIDWLDRYPLIVTPEVYVRMRWYTIINSLLLIKQYYRENQQHKMNDLVLFIKQILAEIQTEKK